MSQNQMLGRSIEQTLGVLPENLKAKYSSTLDVYIEKIIPFEEKRLIQISNIQKKNISLQRKKLQLARKISLLKQHNAKNQSTLQSNSLNINDLQNTLLSLEVANNQNKDEIMVLKMTINELEQDLNLRVNSIKENDNKKNEAMGKYEKVNDQYNMLLSNFMKDKNLIAEKLNQLNEFQLRLHDRQSKNAKQTNYIKQLWLDLQKLKKQSQLSRPKIFKNKEGNSLNPNSNIANQKIASKPETDKKPKYIEKIISQPIKKIIKHHAGQIFDIGVNMKSSLVATCSSDQSIKIFDIHKFESKSVIKSASGSFFSIAFDKFGERLAAGGLEKSVQIFDPLTGKELHKFVEHILKVNSVSYSFHKSFFLSGSEDKSIKAWDVEKTACAHTFSCGKPVKCLATNQSQPYIYSGHSDGSVRIYGFDQPTPIFQIKGIIDYSITSIAPLDSNPNQMLVSSQQGSPIYLFDLKANKSIAKFEAKDYFNKNSKISVSPSEKYVLGGNCDGYIYYWNKQNHGYEKKISGHDYGVTALKFIEKDVGQFLLISSDIQGNVIVWH